MNVLLFTTDVDYVERFTDVLNNSSHYIVELRVFENLIASPDLGHFDADAVLFLDLNLLRSKKSGNLIKKVIQNFAPIPLIVLVDKGNFERAHEALAAGAVGFLQGKYINVDLVDAVIAQALAVSHSKSELIESRCQLQHLMDSFPGVAYCCQYDGKWTMKFISEGCEKLTGYSPQELIDNKLVSYADLIHLDDREKVWQNIQDAVRKDKHFQLEYRFRTKREGEKWFWERGQAIENEDGLIVLEGFITDITDRCRQETQMRRLIEIGEIIREEKRKDRLCQRLLEKINKLANTKCGGIGLLTSQPTTLFFEAATGAWKPFEQKKIDINDCEIHNVIQTGVLQIFDLQSEGERICRQLGSAKNRFLAVFPLSISEKKLGVLVLGKDHPIPTEELTAYTTIVDMISSAIDRLDLFVRTESQLKKMESLHAVDQTITGVFDFNVVAKIILNEVVKHLGADAADILILNSVMNSLDYAGSIGYRERKIASSQIPLSTSIAGSVLLDRKVMKVPDLDQTPLNFTQRDFHNEKFHAYFAFPLIAKGKPVGVLEVFYRQPFYPDYDWFSYLEIIISQTAVAYDSYRMYSDLQQVKQNIMSSYHATLESWSSSLELQAAESPGHIRKVTDQTIELAKIIGASDDELARIERGALLHDIGKIGIMDQILLKKAELTEEEWREIKRHPQIARDMLSNIQLLKESMDIPYSHHENWDGSGYPQGLKGEDIPLAARIFAVVDTFDALISDRPFRSAWPKEEAIEFLRSQKGKRFDPEIVDLFLSKIITG